MILVDINILLDVAQRRVPHYAASATVIEDVLRGRRQAMVVAHAVTTLHYLLRRFAGRVAADRHLAWVLKHFEVGDIGRDGLQRALALGWNDFEDAVTAVAAAHHRCKVIVTRNPNGFRESPVPACLPEELAIDAIHESFARYA